MIVRRLVLFDIDGTLTATNAVDDECYCQAIAAELGLKVVDIKWATAPHITDTGIAHWLWAQHRNRPPSSDELSAVRTRFVSLLEHQLASSQSRFRAVRGAVHSLLRLRKTGWTVAFATGGWGESARIKLRAAGIAFVGIPLACADDALSRAEILAHAWRMSASAAGGPLDRVVSVGDAEWDVAAARRLALPFVGIAAGEKADRLKVAGASHVLADLDYHALRGALLRATVPRSASDAPA
jgi:phosphoglycolate phosphatase-like HAD superfamily hydrolase